MTEESLDILFVILLLIPVLIPVALIIWGMISTIRADKKRIRRHGYRNSNSRTSAWAITGWIVLLIIYCVMLNNAYTWSIHQISDRTQQ